MLLTLCRVTSSAGHSNDQTHFVLPIYAGMMTVNIDAPEAATNTYTVQSGDNLSKIGSKYGVTWQQIFEANRDKLSDPDKIHPGQELNIPS